MTPLDPTRDADAALLRLLGASGGAARALHRETTLDDLGLDELDRAHLAHRLERDLRVRVDPAPDLALGAILDAVDKRLYWHYAPPPTDRAADLARADFVPRLVRPALHLAFRGALRAGFRYRVENRRAIPKKGAFVLVANHNGHADAPALMACLPLRRVNTTHPLAAQDYFFKRRLVGSAVHVLLNALPIDRTQRADAAMRDGLDLLSDGRGVVLFPEGTRSATGEMGPFKKGVGLLLAGKPWPAVPAWIEGSRDVLPKGASRPRLAPLRVRLGDPVHYSDVTDEREGWKKIAADLEARVRALGASE